MHSLIFGNACFFNIALTRPMREYTALIGLVRAAAGVCIADGSVTVRLHCFLMPQAKYRNNDTSKEVHLQAKRSTSSEQKCREIRIPHDDQDLGD